MGFRDPKFSFAARRAVLEEELDGANSELERREDELPSLFFRLFPMLENYSKTAENVNDAVSHTVLLGLLGTASVVALPLAILWHSQRRDVRALRKAKRRVRKLTQQVDEATRLLGPGERTK